MQVHEIKRPALIEPFFNLEIDFKNDYVEYISTTNQNAVTPQHNNTTTVNQNETCFYLELNEESFFWLSKGFYIAESYDDHLIQFHSARSFSILETQSHNNALSLM